MIRNILVALVVVFALPACASDLGAVVDRHIAWRGGEAMKKLETIKREGELAAAGLTGSVSYIARKDGYSRTDFDLSVVKGATAITPRDSWTTNNSGQVTDLSENGREDEERALALEFLAPLFGQTGDGVSLLAPEEKDGATYQVIRIAYDNGDHTDLFIAADGALDWLRLKQDQRTVWRKLEDWRLFDGVRLPGKITETSDISDQEQIATWTSTEINAVLDERLFARPSTVSRVEIAGGGASTGWIGFDFFREERLFVDGAVNGAPTSIILDSGADVTVIDKAFADKIGLVGEGELPVSGTGGTETVQIASGVTIVVGDLTLRDITVAILDLSGVARRAIGRDMPVILGTEVFTETIVDIDYPNRRIAFHDPSRWGYEGEGVRIPLIERGASRSVMMAIDGRDPVTVGFDLGQGGALTLFDAYTKEAGLLDGRKTATSYGGGVGGGVISKLARLDGVELGGFVFDDVPVRFSGGTPGAFDTTREQGNLGMGILKRFRLITDYDHDALYLEFNKEEAAKPFDHNHAGVDVALDKSGVRVTHVAAGSPAAAAGLKDGDIITRIGGKRAGADYFTTGLWRWIYAAPGANVKLTLAGGGDIAVTLAEYY